MPSWAVGTMPPVRPWKATGLRPSTARRTSSTICPADSSTTRIPRARSARPGGGAGGHDDQLGIVEELARPADLSGLDGAVLRLEVLVVHLQVLRLQVER